MRGGVVLHTALARLQRLPAGSAPHSRAVVATTAHLFLMTPARRAAFGRSLLRQVARRHRILFIKA